MPHIIFLLSNLSLNMTVMGDIFNIKCCCTKCFINYLLQKGIPSMPQACGHKMDFTLPRMNWVPIVQKVLLAIFILGTHLPFSSPVFADILLRPGDDIQLRVSSLPTLDISAQVNLDGSINFAWMGRFRASERALKDLEQEIQTNAVGKIVKQYNSDGVLFIIQLEGDEVYLIRGPYQPIIVSGDVARPGTIAFKPNVTVRDAIAIAGGTDSGLLDGLLVTDPAQILRWQGDFGTAALQHAEGTAILWRTNAEIDQDYDALDPDPSAVRVSTEVFDELVLEQRRLLKAKQETEAGEREFFAEALKKAKSRIDILKLQQVQLSDALAFDEEDEERIKDLVTRGLAPSARKSEVRRNTIISATRLLDLEEVLASAELEIARQTRERNEFEELRLINLFGEKREAQTAIRTAAVRMDVLSKYLAGQSTDFGSDDIVASFSYSATIYRKEEGGVTTLMGDENTVLLPGDTLEISLSDLQNITELSEGLVKGN